jgi:uncharacterized protein (DUF1501 family)
MNRRDFLRYSLLGAGALGLKLYSIPAFAVDGRKEKLIYIFLRGGADFLSIFPPKLKGLPLVGDARKEYKNHPLYEYRGLTEKMCESFLFGSAAFPFGDYIAGKPNAPLELPGYPVDFHPGFSAMRPVLATDNVAVLLHTGSANVSRSHFDQQDMIESGSSRTIFGSGYLARAASLLEEGRHTVAIGGNVPKSLNGADVPLLLSAADLKGPGSVAGRVYAAHYEANGELRSGLDLQDRLGYFRNASDVNCESGALCKTAKGAQAMYEQLEKDLTNSAALEGSTFKKACSFAAQLTNASFNPAIMTIDFPGWDHHFGEHPKVEKSALYAKVQDLAAGLSALYQGSSDDTVVVVMSEFGRTVVGNQSLGTDHGRGGAMMVMGKRISRSRISGMPSAWDLTSFEGTNGSRALKVKIDYREIMAELLDKHLQIPWKSDSPLQDKHINKVFDGLSAYRRRGLV